MKRVCTVAAIIGLLLAGVDIDRIFNGGVDAFFGTRWLLYFGVAALVFTSSMTIYRLTIPPAA